MKPTLKIQSLKNQTWLATDCVIARTFLTRLRGLIGTQRLEVGQGLLLEPCNDIHMWMMSIPIDVIFVRREMSQGKSDRMRVTSFHSNLQPWKLLPVRDRKASATLELPSGTLARCDIQPGDELCLS